MMEQTKINRLNLNQHSGLSRILPALILWGTTLLLGVGLFWFYSDSSALGNYYLLPWCLISGVVIIAPSVYFYFKGNFNFFNPLVFSAWSYIFPAFVIGGIILSFGWSEPYYYTFIDDPKFELPLSLMYVTVGYLGMTIGYFLPWGKKISNTLEKKLPAWDWDVSKVWIGGILLIITGFGVNIISFARGLVGFQKVDSIESFDGLLLYLTILLGEGIFLLWLFIFQSKERNILFYSILAMLIILIPVRAFALGSRGGFIVTIIQIAMAFAISGRKLKWQHTSIFGFLGVIALSIGMIYGTTFRNIKGTEARMEAGDYVGQISATIDYLSNQDIEIVLSDGIKALAERIENLSAVGVVVSNYEKLAPYEAAYGLENNILNDLLYSFIPRFVWTDKPVTSDSRAYSDLYFNYGENSFTVTPFGDLLRNFGPLSIPLGMLLVGIYLRVIYSTLIETSNPTIWKKLAYYPLITAVSYESFYATIFPTIIRVLIVLAISIIFINFFIKKYFPAK